MKRSALAIMIGVSLISVGCSNKTEKVEESKTPEAIVEYITEDKAREIVLAEIKNGEIVEFSFDKDDVIPNYDISVSDGTNIYGYEIDAVSGDILETETKIQNEVIDDKDLIGEEKAKAIVLEKVANGEIIEISLDKDDNIVNYDVTISDGEYEYEYEVNAKDGNIIAESKELINK